MTQSPGQSNSRSQPNQAASSGDVSAMLQGIAMGPNVASNPIFGYPSPANTQTPSNSATRQNFPLPPGQSQPRADTIQTPSQDPPSTDTKATAQSPQSTAGQPGNANTSTTENSRQNLPSRAYSQAEVDSLLQKIASLESASRHPLIGSMEDIENARALAKATAEASKEKPLPDPIEGFKEDPLNNLVSERIDEAVKANKYIPLSAIANQAKQFAPDDEEIVMYKDGAWKAKSIDRKGEKSLPFNEWLAAGKTLHFENAASIFNSHNMAIAYAYDIRQRELASRNPLHDIAPLDITSLNLITSSALAASSNKIDSLHSAVQSLQSGNSRQSSIQSYPSTKQKPNSFEQLKKICVR